jgi:hypothetical protein
MQEFYRDYTKELLKKIVEAFKSGNKNAAKEYTLELKELNKTIFLDKQLCR